MAEDRPVLSTDTTETFRALVHDAITRRKLAASADTEFYLVALLDDCVKAESGRFFEPLGPAYLRALSGTADERFARLKAVGDTTLILCGVFRDRVEEAAATTEYYYTLGSAAYSALETAPRRDARGALRDTFHELGGRFADFAELLTSIGDTTLFRGQKRALRIFERWQDQRRGIDAARLIDMGWIPAGPSPGKAH